MSGPAPRYAERNAPELAVLRMAAALEATGVPVEDTYLVNRAISARGILNTQANRKRYRAIVDRLITAKLLTSATAVDLGLGSVITVTEKGATALTEQRIPS